MKTYKVLITAVGGNIGQGILKALRNSRKKFYIVGIDAEPLSAGFSFCDSYYQIPKTTDKSFNFVLEQILQKENPEAIYVCSPSELEFYCRTKDELEKKYNLSIFVNSLDVVCIGSDKLKTANFLKDYGFAYPETTLADDEDGIKELVNRFGFPLFMKPRKGFTSFDVFTVNSYEQIHAAKKLIPDLILQRYIPDSEKEYTAGTVSGLDKKLRAHIILHRYLNQGTTYRTELVTNEEMSNQIIKISEALGSIGPCNFQFRFFDGEIIIFEINPRFSGTSGIRYLYGFNDPEMVFDIFRLGKDIRQPKLKPVTVLRYWNEVYIPGVYFDDVRNKKISHHGIQIVVNKSFKV